MCHAVILRSKNNSCTIYERKSSNADKILYALIKMGQIMKANNDNMNKTAVGKRGRGRKKKKRKIKMTLFETCQK